MMVARLTALIVAVSAIVMLGSMAGAEGLAVEVQPDRFDVVIGQERNVEVTFTNLGEQPTGPLVAHLVVMDPAGGGSADAEDWTTELNRLLPSLAPGESQVVLWDTKPIMAGSYLVMITVAPTSPTSPIGAAASNAVPFDVRQPNVLVSGATVPVAAATPVAVLILAVATAKREKARVRALSLPSAA